MDLSGPSIDVKLKERKKERWGGFTDNTKPGYGGSNEGSKWAPTGYHFTDNFNTSAKMLIQTLKF